MSGGITTSTIRAVASDQTPATPLRFGPPPPGVGPDDITVTAGGSVFGGWEEIEIARSLKRMATHFNLTVSARWVGQDVLWRLLPGTPVVVRIGPDVVLTGYVNEYQPALDVGSDRVHVVGRSLTQDLIDCSPDPPSGQYGGYTFGAIATSLCAIFGLQCLTLADGAAQIIPDATLTPGETAFAFLGRLAQQAGVLLADDELGRLVLVDPGARRSSGTLIEGQNLLSLRGKFTDEHRFSDYIFKGQRGSTSAANVTASDPYGAIDAAPGAPAASKASAVQTQQRVVSHDSGVTRYRPKVMHAETTGSLDDMQSRADWQRAVAFGHSLSVETAVAGWRQPDGRPWTVNEMIPITAPHLGLDQDLAIEAVRFGITKSDGRTTRLSLCPLEGLLGDWKKARKRKGKHGKKGGGGINYDTVDQ